MKNRKGFTLVELLAVIVVLGIVMGIAAVAITNVLDSTRKNAFVASAKQFVEGAKALVEADMVEAMLGGKGEYVLSCDSASYTASTGEAEKVSDGSFVIKIADIKTKGGTNDKTPWGSPYDTANSKVYVTVSNNCETFSYRIYLVENGDAHYISNGNNSTVPVAEGSLDSSHVFTK